MGEAKRKRKLREKILEANPMCIYCGGLTPAKTVEHIPAKIVFNEKQRPKGLEFSACQQCNNNSGPVDLVAAMMARVYPDVSGEYLQQEVQRIFESVNNNVHGLLEEMKPENLRSDRIAEAKIVAPADSHPIYCGGPIMTRHMTQFGAKIGMALHYEQTRRIVPLEGNYLLDVP